MPSRESLAATDVAGVMRAFRGALEEHREAINRLNVYPVPDGDTGTNMALTMGAVVAELDGGPEMSMADVAKAMSHGSLMGARGNSGVILSQVLRGMAGAFTDAGEQVGGAALADALRQAADGAYAAVSNPVEGTMLSVARAAAEGAEKAGDGKVVGAGADVLSTLEAARAGAAAGLARTTEQLPALTAAGVVDAGGAGYLLLVESFLTVVDGRVPEAPPRPANQGQDQPNRPSAARGGAGPGSGPVAPAELSGVLSGLRAGDAGAGEGEPGVGDLRYEVMFLLEVPDESVPGFRSVWGTVGGSIVIVGGDGLYNCHIHTDDVGAAIEAAIEIGRPRQIRVTDLREQVEEERWVREAESAGAQQEPPAEPRTCAVVAVGAGEGVKRIFRSLGVSQVVAGGQSANPSTAQVLDAIAAAPAEQVIVLPNNANVVPVAHRAAAQSGKKVRVVPTEGVPEGFAALLDYDPEADVDTNADSMAAAAQRVVAGEVAQAARQASTPAGPVKEGDWLGMDREGVKVVAPSPSTAADAAIALLDALVVPGHEIVTIIEGDTARAADTRHVEEWLAEHHPQVCAEVLHGGQPLYPYLFSIE